MKARPGLVRVCFADIHQPRFIRIPHRKRVVAEHANTLAVTVLDGGYDDVERGQFALHLQP
jgi:hypothetical protein